MTCMYLCLNYYCVLQPPTSTQYPAGPQQCSLTFIVPLRQQVEAIEVDGVPAQHTRQPLVVGDVLVDGRHDAPRILEELFVTPVVVEFLQPTGDPVVFTHEEGVQRCKAGLLRRTCVPWGWQPTFR